MGQLQYRALLIGIDAYERSPLQGCVNDIDSMEALLLDRLQVPPERIVRLAAPRSGGPSSSHLESDQPGLLQIQYALRGLARVTGDDDSVLIYYSGHGSETRVRSNSGQFAREALVPVDYSTEDARPRLLYDFELNALLAAIAARARDLTVVLDCCHAGGLRRDPGEANDVVRCYPVPERHAMRGDPDAAHEWRGMAGSGTDRPFVTLAACTAGEPAREVAGDGGRRHGALTLALLEQLSALDDQRLPLARWADFWPALQASVAGRSAHQHPRLDGRSERRVFGGPWEPSDPGFGVRVSPDGFCVAAGTVAGVTVGAELSVYAATPLRLPAIGSAQDSGVRLGQIRIVDASPAWSMGVALGEPFAVPPGARARVHLPGMPDRLVVAVEPFDAHLATHLGIGDALELVPHGNARAEATLRHAQEHYFLGDAVHGDGRGRRPALFTLPDQPAERLGRVLRHYARYNTALRLPRRCLDLPDALNVTLLDCNANWRIRVGSFQDPALQPLPVPQFANYRVAIGGEFCVRVDNRASEALHVTLLNCAGSGRVEFLGEAEVQGSSFHVFWATNTLGVPFAPRVEPGGSGLERIIAVGTTRPDQDFSALVLDQSFSEVVDSVSLTGGDRLERDLRPAPRTSSGEKWTAVQVALEITSPTPSLETRSTSPDYQPAEQRDAPNEALRSRVRKIAILGGGMGALSAAFELTHQRGWDRHYEITVYQQGFRLGGKGASGRDPNLGNRIEEHGLHVWMGFYENAFRLIRDCYADPRRRRSGFVSWTDAFKPHSRIVLEEQVESEWRHWGLDVPTNSARPGERERLPSARQYVELLLAWMRGCLHGDHTERVVAGRRDEATYLDQALETFRQGMAVLDRDESERRDTEPDLRSVFDAVAGHLDRFVASFKARLHDDAARRTFLLLDLAATHVRGLIADRLVLTNDFTCIDHLDYKRWLSDHGAAPTTVESAPVNALYDLVFSIDRGIAAGTTLVCAFRMLFTYAGAIFYEMQAGMGDVVFAPLYRVLSARGVKFEFFHRVDELTLAHDKRAIAGIELSVQARLAAGIREYEPLYSVDDVECWPNQPRWEQLADGERLRMEGRDFESHWGERTGEVRTTLRAGRDFDLVILGIPVGAHRSICRQLMASSRRFCEMVEGLATCRTQAMQLWFTRSLPELGWEGRSPVQGSYAEPYDTWADMTHLLGKESWPAPDPSRPSGTPKSLAYLCGYLDDSTADPSGTDTTFNRRESARAKGLARTWLRDNAAHLWPRGTLSDRSSPLNPDLLFDPANGSGDARFDAQYFRANVNPSDRYVLSVPGSTRFRLRADQSGFENLYLAGDWLRTGLDGGCIEAAVMGGLQACKAIWRDVGFEPESPRPIVGGIDIMPSPPRRSPTGPALPTFIERGGDVIFRHPYVQRGTRLTAFVLCSRHEALQALCDRQLNIGGDTVFMPLAPYVVAVCADIERTGSDVPGDREKGWMAERDASFWVPVVAGRRLGDVWVPSEARISWFLPYMWVDNAIAMAAGREVFGFPKQVAEFAISARDPACFSVTTDVITEFGTDSRVGRAPILEVVRTAGAPRYESAGWGSMSAVWQAVIDAFNAKARDCDAREACLDPVVDLLTRADPRDAPLVFLKQFRDVADPRRACYQAVLRAWTRTSALRRGGLLDASQFRVRVFSYDSHPLARDLGFAPGNVVDLEPLAGFWLDFDFSMELGCVVQEPR